MSASNLQGFSNLVAGGNKTEPTNPKWLNKSTDTIHSTQGALPVIDLSQADIASQSASVQAASKRIVDRAKSQGGLKSSRKTSKPRKKIVKKQNRRKVVKTKQRKTSKKQQKKKYRKT